MGRDRSQREPDLGNRVDVPTIHIADLLTDKDQIIIYAVTPPNEPHQYILTHFNNCNFSKAQIVRSLMLVFYTETCRSFLMSILMQI